MSDELVTYEQRNDLAINRAPDVVLSEAKRAAKSLQDVIANKRKPVIFNGEQYLEFEDWQTVGRFYGVTVKVAATEYVEFGGVIGFQARAVVIRQDGMEISAAEAMCLNDEPNWSKKPLFQLRSMAQTRACAKALRNVLAWVVVLAGYKATPAEEMTGQEHGKSPISAPQEKKTEGTAETESVISGVDNVTVSHFKKKDNSQGTKYIIHAGEKYETFSETIATEAKKAKEAGLMVTITYKTDAYGRKIDTFTVQEPRMPGSEG